MRRSYAARANALVAIIAFWLFASCAAADIDEGRVCGHDNKSYDSKEEALLAGTTVMHCGKCGECSNRNDIDIYDRTRNTLTETTTRCAYAYLVLGRRAAALCMRRAVGFTETCDECWLDNIECDMRECLWICLKHTLGGSANNEAGGDLNDCLACDEEKCGPAFIDCAGANRRRSGIISDIGRPGEQVCEVVDPWPELAGGAEAALEAAPRGLQTPPAGGGWLSGLGFGGGGSGGGREL